MAENKRNLTKPTAYKRFFAFWRAVQRVDSMINSAYDET